MAMNYDIGVGTHYVNHKFKEEIIVPLCSLSNNIDFLMSGGDKYVITADKKLCKVTAWKERHVCELGEDVRRIYGIDIWSFIQRWYKVNNCMDSMYFVQMQLSIEQIIN